MKSIPMSSATHTHRLVQTSRRYTVRATSTQLKGTIFLKIQHVHAVRET